MPRYYSLFEPYPRKYVHDYYNILRYTKEFTLVNTDLKKNRREHLKKCNNKIYYSYFVI